jgi:hypothetical protein
MLEFSILFAKGKLHNGEEATMCLSQPAVNKHNAGANIIVWHDCGAATFVASLLEQHHDLHPPCRA